MIGSENTDYRLPCSSVVEWGNARKAIPGTLQTPGISLFCCSHETFTHDGQARCTGVVPAIPPLGGAPLAYTCPCAGPGTLHWRRGHSDAFLGFAASSNHRTVHYGRHAGFSVGSQLVPASGQWRLCEGDAEGLVCGRLQGQPIPACLVHQGSHCISRLPCRQCIHIPQGTDDVASVHTANPFKTKWFAMPDFEKNWGSKPGEGSQHSTLHPFFLVAPCRLCDRTASYSGQNEMFAKRAYSQPDEIGIFQNSEPRRLGFKSRSFGAAQHAASAFFFIAPVDPGLTRLVVYQSVLHDNEHMSAVAAFVKAHDGPAPILVRGATGHCRVRRDGRTVSDEPMHKADIHDHANTGRTT